MNGLDLFSGIGGISLALEEWVRPVIYCESDPYCQGVLLSRMRSGNLSRAPIWDDVRTLKAELLPGDIGIIYAGFPCQDISVAGTGRGLEGERSGLFFEIVRLVNEIRPEFVFLENVAAITIRGMERCLSELVALGYDCRWTILSAAAVGAPHVRERWWMLAHINEAGRRELHEGEPQRQQGGESKVADDASPRLQRAEWQGLDRERGPDGSSGCDNWWATEPSVVRVVHGLPFRRDRIKGLGNSVVPQCAKEAFKILMGLQ